MEVLDILREIEILTIINLIRNKLIEINDFIKISNIFFNICKDNVCIKNSKTIQSLIDCVCEYIKNNCSNEEVYKILNKLNL